MQRFTFKSRGKGRQAEAGRSPHNCSGRGEKSHCPCSAHVPGVLPVNATCPAGSHLNFPVLRRRRGKQTDAKHPYTFRKDFLVLSFWGMGWGGRWEGGSGWGTHAHPWLIHVNVWQKPLQHCKVTSLQLKKKKRMHLDIMGRCGVWRTGVCRETTDSNNWKSVARLDLLLAAPKSQ